MAEMLVGLARVSTEGQGQSGLGVDAQNAAIESYRRMIDGTLLKTYVEIESGMHDDVEGRPQLRAAASHARLAGATLVIAKIDRLVRSTVVMAYLKSSKVKFVACDNPYANELTIDILVAVAADEGRRIRLRTRDALAAYKAGRRVSKRIRAMYPDGVPDEVAEATAGKLGASLPQCRNLTDEARREGLARSAVVRKARALDAYGYLADLVVEKRAGGMTLRQLAELLNADGHKTRNGRPWNPVQVSRVLARFAPAGQPLPARPA